MPRTVSETRSDLSNSEMEAIGYLIIGPLLILLLPLLPVLIVIWLVSRSSNPANGYSEEVDQS